MNDSITDFHKPTMKQSGRVKNIFSADVEDYFHVSAFDHIIKYSEWGTYKSRIIPNVIELIGLLDQYNIRGTFFILGWVAEKFPEVVSLIHQNGHEIGCHSYLHRLIYKLTPDQFREDTKRAKNIIELVIDEPVYGYRAPSFSITRKSQWAWDILAELGFKYSSSIYPIVHDRYGFQNSPRVLFDVQTKSGKTLTELPMSTIKIMGRNFPVAGGGYLRLFPYWFTRYAVHKLNNENIPAVVYMHPWELDFHQPRMDCGLSSRFRHYVNLKTTESKLTSLFKEFEFTRIIDYINSCPD